MRVTYFRSLPILVLSGLLISFPSAQAATANVPQPAPAKPPVTYPQIVRLSYVEGDVRVSRGKEGNKADEKEAGEETGWEQAPANLPLQAGFSLVTGKGRAEIEFEDASTVYLGENSILTFDALSATGGVPFTNLELLSGTATLNVRPMVTGEWFILNTPGDNIALRYPQRAYLRVNSYLDAIGLTSESNLVFNLPAWGRGREMPQGQTMMFHNGQRVYAAMPDAAASTAWDTWVGQRVQARDAAMSAAMKAAGLTAPVPGLAEMNGQGRFFSCEPYGTCWEPAKGWTEGAVEVAQSGAQAGVAVPAAASAHAGASPVVEGDVSSQAGLVDKAQVGGASQGSGSPGGGKQNALLAYQVNHPGATLRTEDDFFPCSPDGVSYLIARDPVTGQETVIDSVAFGGYPFRGGFRRAGYWGLGLYPSLWGYPYLSAYPWDWAVCHTGSWIRRERRYVWVVGTKRHHRRPVRWVKTGHSVGYVPIHPRDVAGKPPINLKDGIFVAKGDKGERSVSLVPVDVDGGKGVRLLDEAPKEFRNADAVRLERAEIPHAEAHAVTNMLVAGGGGPKERGSAGDRGPATGRAVPITFDRKSQSFGVATQVMQGGRPSTVVEPLGARGGNLQARGGEGSGGGSAGARSSNYGGAENRGASSSGANAGSSRASSPAPSSSGGGGGSFHASAPSAPSGGGSSGGGAARSH